MRSFGRFGLVVAMLTAMVCSCSQKPSVFSEQATPHHFQELQQAATMMADHPEQALQQLETMAPSASQWSEPERHELRLLTTEAQYKTGRLNASSYPLDETVEYFDSLAQQYPDAPTLRFLHANACYYLGTEDRLAQHDVKAAADFVTALEVLRSGLLPDDARVTRFKGLCHYRLGEILYDYNIQASALSVFDSAGYYFGMVNDTLGVAACIRNAGEIYQGNKDYERALTRFKEANALWDFGDDLYDHAIGGMFFEHHQYDSASLYLERSFLTGGPYTRIDASAKLAELFKEKGNKEKEDYYTLFYIQNSIRETNRSSDKMEIEFLVDAMKPEPAPDMSRSSLSSKGIVLVGTIVVVIALMAFIIIHNRHRISSIEKQLTTLEKSHREVTEDKDQQIQSISKELNDTKQQLERRRNVTPIDLGTALDNYLKAPNILKIKKSVKGKDIMTKSVGLYPNLKLSEMDFIEVVKTANTCFPDFSTHFLQDHNELSTVDLRHCCLALMGLNDAEIAVMEGITYSGANRRTKRILSIMGSESGLEESILLYLKDIYN